MFKFKGKSSAEMGVIIEEEELFLAKASQKYEVIDIDGRDGSLFNELGYSNIEIAMNVQILKPNKLDEIFEWLNGVGEFEYNGRITTAYFYQEIESQRFVSIKSANIMFIRNPFWRNKNQSFITVSNNSIINSGNIISKPIIRLEKKNSDFVELTVGNVRFKYNFNSDSYVEIDCNEYIATFDLNNRNRNLEIGFLFPVLNPGENKVVIHSGDAIIKIKDKDRWL